MKADPKLIEATPVIRWESDVAKHDFEAAREYLSLRFDEHRASDLVRGLRKVTVTTRRANDILRSCGRPPLSLDDPGVRRDLIKVARGERLSPVLLVSFDDGAEMADGYHRVSLAYTLDPFGMVPLRMVAMQQKT